MLYAPFLKTNKDLNYKVEKCERPWAPEERMPIEYDEFTKTLTAYVWVNCCGTEIKVEKEDSTYKIIEKQYGTLCRCMCTRKVTVFNASKEFKVIFINKDEKEFILTPY